jgi:hypothetical protein
MFVLDGQQLVWVARGHRTDLVQAADVVRVQLKRGGREIVPQLRRGTRPDDRKDALVHRPGDGSLAGTSPDVVGNGEHRVDDGGASPRVLVGDAHREVCR